MKKLVVMLLASAVIVGSCNFEKIGSNVTAGIKKNAGGIAKNAVLGAGEGLADKAFQQRLDHLLDSMVFNVGTNGKEAVKAILDSLLSERLIHFTGRMVEEATGRKLQSNLAAVSGNLKLTVQDLLGAETKERLRLLVATAMNEVNMDKITRAMAGIREELTGSAMRNNIALFGENLLNEKTNAAVKTIVDTAMMTIAYRMKHDVKDAIGDNASFIQKYAGRLLLLLGAIALIIIIVIWRMKQKYARMTTVLASQIYAIPDQNAYDDLTYRIKEKATLAGVEPTLRKMLAENGLLGKETRESWQLKKAAVLQNKN